MSARVNVSGSFLENFDFKIEADFGANSLSEQSGYRAAITDAYLNWNRFAAANVKFGQFKTPFGYEQLTPDPKALTIERSLPNDRLTDGRQIGLGVAGDFLKKRVGYSVGVFNGSGVNNSFNDKNEFLYSGRLFGVPVLTKLGQHELRWTVAVNGLSTRRHRPVQERLRLRHHAAQHARQSFTGGREMFGFDTQLRWGPIGLEAEHFRARFCQASPGLPTKLSSDGWHVTATYSSR